LRIDSIRKFSCLGFIEAAFDRAIRLASDSLSVIIPSLPARTDRRAAIMPSGLTAGSAFALMSRTAPGVHHHGTMTSVPSPSNVHQI